MSRDRHSIPTSPPWRVDKPGLRVRPLTSFVAAGLAALLAGSAALAETAIPDRLFPGHFAPMSVAYPQAPHPPKDHLVAPPGESYYFPIRSDGQPYVLNVDTMVNMTDELNRFYYNLDWEGEVWSPFNQVEIVERGSRMMATWPEYSQFSQLRILNGVNRTLERLSGFGP